MSESNAAAIVALLVAVAAPAAAQAPRAGDLTLERRTIRFDDAETRDVELGTLLVPENRSVPDSRLIELVFLRLPARAGADGPPLVYLEGGPGGSAVTENPDALERWTPLLDVGDVILLDQRGTGRSGRLVYGWDGPAPTDIFLTEERGLARLREAAVRAAAHFRERGVDLRGYTTEESADDVNDLRVALGAAKVNLLGFSYGTHLGLSVIRRHGEHIENAVLIGVEGPDHTFKLPSTMDTQFRKLALMAAADPEVSRHVPDLNALLDSVLERLEREPMVVEVRDPRNGESVALPIGADGLRFILRRDIGDASDLPVFPRLLHSIDRGDPTLLAWFVQKRYQLGVHAMSAVMDAASGASPERLARIRAEAAESRFGNVMNAPGLMYADVFDAPDLGEEYRSPLVSDVRTLFLAGTLDWNTPPFQAEEVRWGFPNSTIIVVENAGHEQILPHPEVQRAILAFLRGESVDDVTAAWPPMRFVPIEGYDPEVTHPSVPRPER